MACKVFLSCSFMICLHSLFSEKKLKNEARKCKILIIKVSIVLALSPSLSPLLSLSLSLSLFVRPSACSSVCQSLCTPESKKQCVAFLIVATFNIHSGETESEGGRWNWGAWPGVALANFTNINYDFISSQSAVLSTSLSHSLALSRFLFLASPCGCPESLRLWRNLINFTLLEESCAGCQKSVQMINELINMRQKFPLPLLTTALHFPTTSHPPGWLKIVPCGKCNYALCDLRKFSLHTFRLGQLQSRSGTFSPTCSCSCKAGQRHT